MQHKFVYIFSKIYSVSLVILASFLFINFTNAQPNKAEFIQANIGLGASLPTEVYNITGSRFYIQAECIYAPKKWIGFHPYTGFITTSESGTNASLQEYRVTSKAFLLGGKARICAPIP